MNKDQVKKDQAYYKARYPLTMAAHLAACAIPGLSGGNGGPKDEDARNPDGSIPTFTDGSGSWSAQSYNEAHEKVLAEQAARGPVDPGGAVFGGTATR